MSDMMPSISTFNVRCRTSCVSSGLRTLDVRHVAFHLDFERSKSDMLHSIRTSNVSCPTCCLSSGLRTFHVRHVAFHPDFERSMSNMVLGILFKIQDCVAAGVLDCAKLSDRPAPS